MNLQPLLVLIVGIIILGLIWRVVRGVIRLAFTVVLLLVVGYVLLNYLR
jgi:hypothetical protein